MQANNNSLPNSRASLHGKIFWKIFTEKAQLLFHPRVYFRTKTWKSITSNQKGKGDKKFSKLDFEKDIIQIYIEDPITYTFQ